MTLVLDSEQMAVSFGLGLPTIIYLYLLWMNRPRPIRSASPPKTSTEPELPQNVRPALATMFLDGRITESAIAATIVDLLARGSIGILDKGDRIVLVKQRQLSSLPLFEQTMAEHLLTRGSVAKNAPEIEQRINRKLYDQHISQAIRSLYQEGIAHGFFSRDPNAQYARYYLAGLLVFFAGIVSFGLLLRLLGETPTLLFYPLGLLLVGSTLIIKAKHIAPIGLSGRMIQEVWHDYRQELRQFCPTEKHDVYVKYLPYAFALGVEGAWTARWQSVIFTRPDWFTTFETPTRDEFISKLSQVVKALARDLYALRDPALKD